MTAQDRMRQITSVQVVTPDRLRLVWNDGTVVLLEGRAALGDALYRKLAADGAFTAVTLGDWGHGLAWPSGDEVGADSLWLETLSAQGRDDVRAFVEWRLRNGLSLSKAAEALGISRRMVAYYANGEKIVPRTVLLACQGWERLAETGAAA